MITLQISFDGKEFLTHQFKDDSFGRCPVAVPAGAKQMMAFLKVPILDVESFWIPGLMPGASERLQWKFELICGAQLNFPYVQFISPASLNRGAISMTDLVDDTVISGIINQEECTYDLTINTALCGETEPFEILCDTTEQEWTRCFHSWRDVMGFKKIKVPESAWDPVFCTWYAVHGSVDASWVEKNAPLAADLGFRTLIIDDGWCYDEKKRTNPRTITSWYQDVGDWFISDKKFPAIDEHIRKIKALGMHYMLWVAPHVWGKNSAIYRDFPQGVFPYYNEGYYQFNIHCREAQKRIIERCASLVKEHSLDGLKIDFLDIVKNSLSLPNGRETLNFIRDLSHAIRKANPESLIEFRQNYATPAMLPYGTQFRAGDAPFDIDLNFGRTVQIRLGIGSLGPVHADPAYWHKDELPVNVARHMISMMCAVPMLSMDLTERSETELTIIRNYLDFYNAHRKVLNHGRWDFDIHKREIRFAKAQDQDECVIIIREAKSLEKALDKVCGRIQILNLSAQKIALPSAAQCFDCKGILTKGTLLQPGGRAELTV